MAEANSRLLDLADEQGGEKHSLLKSSQSCKGQGPGGRGPLLGSGGQEAGKKGLRVPHLTMSTSLAPAPLLKWTESTPH